MSALRLIDALLLRSLPIANPERLYDLSRQGIGPDGKPQTFDEWAYPDFQLMRAAVKNQAELIAVSHAEPADLTYKSDEEIDSRCDPVVWASTRTARIVRQSSQCS
jgi:putative ABC transport system permease protein